MKIFLFVFFLTFIFAEANAQQDELDSLLQVVSEHPKKDSSKINLYNDIAYTYSQINPSIGKVYADSAIELSQVLKLKAKEMVGLNILGGIYWRMGEDSLALDIYQKVLEYHLANDNQLSLAIIYNNLALISYNSSDYLKALQYHAEAKKIFEELNKDQYLANSLTNTGVVYLALSNYPKSLEYFLNAAKYVDDEKSSQYANIMSNIGLVYKNLKNYQEAEKFQRTAIEIQRELGLQSTLANSLSNLANVFEAQGKTEEALHLYQEALSINQEIGSSRSIASDYSNLGILYQGLKNYPLAQQYFALSDSIYTEIDDKMNRSLVLREKAETLKLVSMESRQEIPYNIIVPLLRQSIQLAEESGSLNRQNLSWLTLSEVLEDMGDASGSLEAFKRHVVFKDSIFNEENNKRIVQQQAAFEYDKKESLLTAEYELEKSILTAKANEARLVRNTLIIAFIFLSFILMIIWNLSRKRIKAENLQKEAEFRTKVVDVELKALRAQMNPHFIFNSLNSISNYMLKNNAEKADLYLQKFSRLIRMILEFSEQKEITLSEELELLELYVQLERLRLDKNLIFDINVDPKLDKDEIMIPPLLLQPLIENSIWHGISPSKQDGLIVLEINESKGLLSCSVKDNGIGRKESQMHKENSLVNGKKSMGLHIIKERIRILNTATDYHGHINWIDISQGLEVEITLPVTNRF